jgi:hypothetical protein
VITGALLALLWSVPMGGSFGDAEATTVSLTAESMVIDLRVAVDMEAHAVLAHLSSGQTTMVIPLVERGEGVYGIRTEMAVKNWIVVFEVLGPEGELSQPVTLGFLGADLGQPTSTTLEHDPGESSDVDEARRWGFLALAFTAASLSALAFWVLGGRDGEEPPAGEEE